MTRGTGVGREMLGGGATLEEEVGPSGAVGGEEGDLSPLSPRAVFADVSVLRTSSVSFAILMTWSMSCSSETAIVRMGV